MNNLSSFNFSQIKFIKTFLGIGISLFLLFLLIKKSQVEFSSAIKAITSLKTLLYFGLSCLSFLLMTLIHAYRTQIIFIDENTTWKSTKALKSLILGNFYNCLLPGNLGEGIRAYHFSKENRISFNKTLAVFFVDFLTFLGFSDLDFVDLGALTNSKSICRFSRSTRAT